MEKVKNKRKVLAGASMVLLLQSFSGTAWAATNVMSTPMSPWDASYPVIQEPQYPPYTVFEGYSGPITFPSAVQFDGGVLTVPARALLERLGYEVQWQESGRVIKAHKNGSELDFPLDQPHAFVNGVQLPLQANAKLVGDTAYVPIRFTVEADNREVEWRASNQTIVIREPNSLRKVHIVSVMETPLEDGALKSLAEQAGALTGLQLQLDARPDQNYRERVNVMIAANDLPDLLLIPDAHSLPKSLISSVFWNVRPFLPEYPRLNELVNQLGWQVKAEDGGVYGIPRMQNAYDGVFPAIRKDWLDRLGLKPPRTMDELLQVMRDFRIKDPDGDTKLNTLGLTGNKGTTGLDRLEWVEQVFNGSGGRYVEREGQIVDTWLEPGTKEALKWLVIAYKEGLLPKDFPVLNAQQAKQQVLDERAGIMAMTGLEAAKVETQLESKMPTAEFVPLTSLKANASGAPVVPYAPGQSGIFAIPKSVTEAKVKRILTFMEAWLSQDGKSEANKQALLPLEPLLGGDGSASAQPATSQVWSERRQLSDASLQNPTTGLFTNEMYAAMADSTKKLNDMKIKVIVGQSPLDAWDMAVEEVRSDAAYQNAMKSLNEKWAARQQ